jgi:aminoglycoside phosphotransferase (APT) family kinase protein
MHANQLTVPDSTVRELVDSQFPQWRRLPISRVGLHGTVNATFRIGEQYAARFPLKETDVASARRSLEAEANAASELLGRTRFPTPEPIAIAEPGPGYPLPWSVQTWLPGVTATDDDPGDSTTFAEDLAEFIRGVRTIPAHGRTFSGKGRGGDLRTHDAWMETCFTQSVHLLDVPRLRQMWATFRELPASASPDLMTHGDLIPGNVLVANGHLAGIIDVGGLAPADPALDLVGAWHLLEPVPRHAFRAGLGSDDLEWERGRAWAFQQAMGVVWYYLDSNPPMSHMGRRTLDRLVAAPA